MQHKFQCAKHPVQAWGWPSRQLWIHDCILGLGAGGHVLSQVVHRLSTDELMLSRGPSLQVAQERVVITSFDRCEGIGV